MESQSPNNTGPIVNPTPTVTNAVPIDQATNLGVSTPTAPTNSPTSSQQQAPVQPVIPVPPISPTQQTQPLQHENIAQPTQSVIPQRDPLLTEKTYPEDLDVKWNSWKCLNCGYVYEGQRGLSVCPRCGNDDPDKFD